MTPFKFQQGVDNAKLHSRLRDPPFSYFGRTPTCDRQTDRRTDRQLPGQITELHWGWDCKQFIAATPKETQVVRKCMPLCHSIYRTIAYRRAVKMHQNALGGQIVQFADHNGPLPIFLDTHWFRQVRTQATAILCAHHCTRCTVDGV